MIPFCFFVAIFSVATFSTRCTILSHVLSRRLRVLSAFFSDDDGAFPVSIFLAGGYLALQFLEVFRGGKRMDIAVERGIMTSGFLLLTSLGLFLIVRDAINLVHL